MKAFLFDAERLADLERIAETGTAQTFLQCDDHTKRLMFASYLDESERRKLAEQRLAEIEAALDQEIEGLRISAHDMRDAGRPEDARLDDIQASRLQRILNGGEE